MSLFHFEKKTCACGSESGMSQNKNDCCSEAKDVLCCIKVLGAGCASCHKMYENTKDAVKALGLHIEVEYITDMKKIMEYGVMSMPVLVINEKVMSQGKVLKAADIKKLLNENK